MSKFRRSAEWCLQKLDEVGWVGTNVRPVIEAFLADHPADDGKKITRKWLRSIGFVDVPSSSGPEYEDDMQKDRLRIWDFNGDYWVISGLDYFELRTRRQLRLLLMALGITTTKDGHEA